MILKVSRAASIAGGIALVILTAALLSGQKVNPDLSTEWTTYGHDPGGMRFSPLKEITPSNVSQLKVAWVYHMKPADGSQPSGRGRRGNGGTGFAAGETTPLVING